MRNVATPLVALHCAFLPHFAFAQNDAAATRLEQIVVTGARTPLPIEQLGSATTIITREEIERRQARYAADLLRSVPGFAISHAGVLGSQAQLRARGAEANHVLVLIDGVRANDPAAGDEFRWEQLSTANIERIEIVRGAQSSLWGSDAISAVVHIITRRDGAAAGLEAFAETGSESTENIGLSGGIGDSDWSLRGGIERLETSGSNISRHGPERDGAELLTAAIAARLAASEHMTFDAGVRLVDATTQYDPVDFFATGLPADGDVATDSRNLTGNVSARWGRADAQLSHRISATYYDSDHDDFADGVATAAAGSRRTSLAWQSDVRVGRNLLALALEHERSSYVQRGAVAFGDPNQDQSMSATSAIAEFQWLSGARVTGLVSARFDRNSDFDDIASGRASLAVRLTAAARLRASLGRGQKNPTFIERFGFFPDQFVGNPALRPEKSTSIDVGIDFEWLDGVLALQTTVFQQDLEDEINGFVFDPVTFLATAANRPGHSERSGVELALQWRAGSRSEIGATYTYTDASEQDALGSELRELRRPRHAGSLSLTHTAADERVQVTFAADYGGSRNDMFFPPFPALSQIITLPDYWLADVAVQFELTSSLTLFARATNLFDADYEQVLGYRTPGRMGFVGIRANLRR